MILSLFGAFAASVCYGVATVLQAIAAQKAPAETQGVDPRLLIRLAGQLQYVAGLALDVLGFAASLVALRSLPLFVVQAVIAANLAVTAVVATRLMGIRLSRAEWAAVAAVCAGLAMLGLSAGRENPAHVGSVFQWTLVACTAALFAAGMAAGRLTGASRAVGLGLVAGLCFGVVAIAARVITDLAPLSLLADPALYALAGAGAGAMLFYAAGLQRGSVTVTTAAVVVAETVVPAAIGVLLLDDSTRPGYTWIAVVGFVLAVLGTLALVRFGEPAPQPSQ